MDQDARKELTPLKLRAKAAKFAKSTVKNQMAAFKVVLDHPMEKNVSGPVLCFLAGNHIISPIKLNNIQLPEFHLILPPLVYREFMSCFLSIYHEFGVKFN